jgi:hypothetical protein
MALIHNNCYFYATPICWVVFQYFVSISFVVFFYEFDAGCMGSWVQGVRGLELWLGRSMGRFLVKPYDGHWVFAVQSNQKYGFAGPHSISVLSIMIRKLIVLCSEEEVGWRWS